MRLESGFEGERSARRIIGREIKEAEAEALWVWMRWKPIRERARSREHLLQLQFHPNRQLFSFPWFRF